MTPEEIKNKQLFTEIYANIIEWMHVNDGRFPDKLEWRRAFCNKLRHELGLPLDFNTDEVGGSHEPKMPGGGASGFAGTGGSGRAGTGGEGGNNGGYL